MRCAVISLSSTRCIRTQERGRWIDAAQHTLVRAGSLRAFGVVDLLVCGTSVQHGLTVLHDDNDFETAARHLTDVRARRVEATEPRGRCAFVQSGCRCRGLRPGHHSTATTSSQ